MPISAAISFSGLSFACLATSRFFGNVMLSLVSSVSGVDEPIDLYAELMACVNQRVEEVLTRGPLAMQQVRPRSPAVVAHDIGYELRHGTTEGRTVGRNLVGEIDGAHFRQQIGRLGSRDPHDRPPVGSVEDADETLILHLINTLCDRRTRSWCSKQEAFTGARAHDKRPVRVAGGASEGDTQSAGDFAVRGRQHEDLGEGGTVNDLQVGCAAAGADLPAVLDGRGSGLRYRAAGDGRCLNHAGASLRGRSARGAV